MVNITSIKLTCRILLVFSILVLLVTPKKSNSTDYLQYFQALVEHHIHTLPNTISQDHDVNCLALNIYHEARGEPLIGQLAVVNVTIKRHQDSPGSSICSIVYSPNQFKWTSKRLRTPRRRLETSYSNSLVSDKPTRTNF